MRKNGVLLHLTSLPSPHGVGTMGAQARAFVDFLVKAGQSCWQILPICPTSYGDSPYQSFSTFAGNPYLIDLDELARDGLLERSEYEGVDWESAPDQVNFGALYQKRFAILRKAAGRLLADRPADYQPYLDENHDWVYDYSLFMALKDAHGGRPWWEWEDKVRDRTQEGLCETWDRLGPDTAFWQAVQYLFFRQWRALKGYANGKGIEIVGDLPIYVSLDSADVWAHRDLFQLDGNGDPVEVAGCPPDGFSAKGQLWGNPLFDWERMARDGYSWWVSRIGYLCRVYDILRIDHFRGFESYYAIPFGSADAINGRWRKGPGMELFRAVERAIGPQPIIAEDLGFLTEPVRDMLRESGFPGMKVLQFAFDGRDSAGAGEYMPHNFPVHCVAYAGTHDNDTLVGWSRTAARGDVAQAREYFHLTAGEGFHWGVLRGLWSSVAELTVVQAQDLLGLDSRARMNTPSTLGGNWTWRALPGAFDDALAAKLLHCMKLYGRCRAPGPEEQ